MLNKIVNRVLWRWKSDVLKSDQLVTYFISASALLRILLIKSHDQEMSTQEADGW